MLKAASGTLIKKTIAVVTAMALGGRLVIMPILIAKSAKSCPFF